MKKEGSKKKAYAFLIISIILVASAVMLFNRVSKTCDNYLCFEEAMANCKQASYVNDDVDATWGYNVIGAKGQDCEINVKLIQTKKGEIGTQELDGLEMNCIFPLGVSVYPQKDLSRCHGLLKEEMQRIVIEKLHKYLIDNMGKIGEKLDNEFY